MKQVLDEAGIDFDEQQTVAPKEKRKSCFDVFVISKDNIVHKNF